MIRPRGTFQKALKKSKYPGLVRRLLLNAFAKLPNVNFIYTFFILTSATFLHCRDLLGLYLHKKNKTFTVASTKSRAPSLMYTFAGVSLSTASTIHNSFWLAVHFSFNRLCSFLRLVAAVVHNQLTRVAIVTLGRHCDSHIYESSFTKLFKNNWPYNEFWRTPPKTTAQLKNS